MVAVMDTYEVQVRRGENWWVLSVPAIRAAHSQSRTLRDVEATARDLIAVMLDVPGDSFDVDVRVTLPAPVAKHLARAEKLRATAAAAQSQAASEVRAAAAELAGLGLPLRDVGQALGVSHQRAHQLVSN